MLSFIFLVEEKPKSSTSTFLQKISKNATANVDAAAPADTATDADDPVTSSPLMQICAFIEALTSRDADGRVVVNRKSVLSACSLKFLLLNPAPHFADVLTQARAVVVAGGTMRPVLI